MQMFFRVAAALGLGAILLAAGEAPDTARESALFAAIDPVASPTSEMAGQEAPLMIASDESLATLDAPAIELEKPRNLAALVADVRAEAEARRGEDLHCLASAVYWESKGEPLDGQLAVAQVILNRVESGRFGSSICAVVKAPKQFSFVRGGKLPAPVAAQQWEVAQAIAAIALADEWPEVAEGATHFHATRVNPGWKMRRIASVGNHVFYR
jgi:N-acetylmuramoyl-L-alanine amidase